MNGKILTFYLGSGLWGIDIKQAQEINRNVEYTPVPGEKSSIVGLLNLRGQVITLLNLTSLLQIHSSSTELGRHCIILKGTLNGSDQIGFFIDRLGDVMDVTEDLCERPPQYVEDSEKSWIADVVKLPNEMLFVLDLNHLLSSILE